MTEMPKIRIIARTEDTVTISRSDLDALIEAAEDAIDLAAVAEHDAYEARVGNEVARRNYYAIEEARRIWDGESRVKIWREKRGLSQRALAERAEISPSYLAEIELDKKPGSLDALRKLARSLDVPVEHLIGD